VSRPYLVEFRPNTGGPAIVLGRYDNQRLADRVVLVFAACTTEGEITLRVDDTQPESN